MERYEKYKDSGVEWVGEIPEHWTVKRLKHVFDSKNTVRVPLNAEERGNMLDKVYDYYGASGVIDLVENYLFDEETILIGEDGANLLTRTKRLAFIARGKYWVNNHAHILKPKTGNIDYLCELLELLDYTEYISGSAQPKLTQEALFSIEIFEPPIAEQTAIASYLDKKTSELDTLISKKEKLIELLKEERTAIINQAVTKGLDPDVEMKDSGVEWLGEIPAHWEVKKLKYGTEILRGKFSHRPRNDESFYGGEYPFIQTGDVAKSNKYIVNYTQTLNEKGYGVSKEFPVGTIVMTIAANIGDIAILTFKACFPDSIVGFYPKNIVSDDYLYFVLKSLRDEFYRTAIENTQLNLNVERIENIHCAFPTIIEQQEICVYVNDQFERLDKLVSKTNQEITLLKEYKTALISEVVTGKVKVV